VPTAPSKRRRRRRRRRVFDKTNDEEEFDWNPKRARRFLTMWD
jgi:hypothetical protein